MYTICACIDLWYFLSTFLVAKAERSWTCVHSQCAKHFFCLSPKQWKHPFHCCNEMRINIVEVTTDSGLHLLLPPKLFQCSLLFRSPWEICTNTPFEGNYFISKCWSWQPNFTWSICCNASSEYCSTIPESFAPNFLLAGRWRSLLMSWNISAFWGVWLALFKPTNTVQVSSLPELYFFIFSHVC